MSEFDAKKAASEVLDDAITPEELAGIKNPNRLPEKGPYVMLIKGYKVFPPNPDKEGSTGACYYDLEVVRPVSGMPADFYPRQSIKFYDVSKESVGMWLKICPDYIRGIKPGTSRSEALDLARKSCVGAQVIAEARDYVWNEEERQRIVILSVVKDN